MSFETLPSRLGNIPEQHFASVPAPPVYDQTHTIKQLAALADYFSPESKAKRKAAVAKANYEYRLYSSGTDPKKNDPFFYYKVQHYQDLHNRMINGLGVENAPWSPSDLAAAAAVGVKLGPRSSLVSPMAYHPNESTEAIPQYQPLLPVKEEDQAEDPVEPDNLLGTNPP